MHDLPAYDAISGSLPLPFKVGQLFMAAAFINDTEDNIRALEALIGEHHIGGLCFFHSRASAATNFEGARNIPYHEDSLRNLQDLIRRYQAAAQYPLLMAIDAEWGLAMRVEHTPQYPYAIALGALDATSESLLYELGLRMARDLTEAGIHWNLSPVVDINTNPDNPVISYRAFGYLAESVSRKAMQLYRGLRDGGVLTCLKHFPGHGDTDVDSHLALPVLKKDLARLKTNELVPFRELIAAGVPAVMPGHLSLPEVDPTGLPASLSVRIISLLREELGFNGVVISDALNMHALQGIERSPAALNTMALEAGNDILCFAEEIPESIGQILEAVDPSRIESSFRRVWELKESVFLRGRTPIAPRFGTRSLNRELARQSLCEAKAIKGSLRDVQREGYTLLSCGEEPTAFIDRIRDSQIVEVVKWDIGQPLAQIRFPEAPHVLLALTPPSMKPVGNFGLPVSFIDDLNELCAHRKVVLYLFGNPYLINKLPLQALRGIICAFQPLEAFQEVAADHFLGRWSAEGILPIELYKY